MRRRELLCILGVAAALPVVARAQQRGRQRRIGLLMNLASDDPESAVRIAAFAASLQELGWSVGRNIVG